MLTSRVFFSSVALFLTCHVQGAQDFAKDILPIFQSKCYNCHRAEHEVDGRKKRPKASLALDSAEAITAGGENGPAVIAGDPAKSYLLEVVTLPPDDDMVMPPEGKGDPLTPEEVEKLKAWIQEGASFGEWKADPIGAGAPASPKDSGANEPAQTGAAQKENVYDTLAKDLPPAGEAAVKAVSDLGGRVQPLAQNHPLLRVDYLMKRKEAGDDMIRPVSGLAENVTELDLGQTQITSAGLGALENLKKLTRLDLHQTKVDDEGLKKLQHLTELRYLNLYGTEVTDAGLEALAPLKKLEKVYLWQSKVTEAGVKRLRELLPAAEVNWQ